MPILKITTDINEEESVVSYDEESLEVTFSTSTCGSWTIDLFESAEPNTLGLTVHKDPKDGTTQCDIPGIDFFIKCNVKGEPYIEQYCFTEGYETKLIKN